MQTTTLPKLTYEENQAIQVIRRTLKRKPELAAALMEGMSKEAAVTLLQQVSKELKDLQAVASAFSTASAALVKKLPTVGE